MGKRKALFLATMAAILLIAGCAGVPKGIPAGKEPQNGDDYFREGVFLAALQFYSWEDRVTTAGIYPVNILTEASQKTKNQAKVRALIRIKEAEENPGGQWQWTKFVFNSRPAFRDELETGMWILCVNEEKAMDADELKNARWAYRQITSLDELYKDLVEVRWYDTYYWQDKTWKINVQNIRMAENHFPEDATF